jgi:hypothetical protein
MELAEALWAEEHHIQWAPTWRFLEAREIILKKFKPRIFSVHDDRLLIRFGKDRDLHLTHDRLSFRLLAEAAGSSVEEETRFVVDTLLVDHVHAVETRMAFVGGLQESYSASRLAAIDKFINPAISYDASDFALTLDLEDPALNDEVQIEFGIVDSDEVLERVARTVHSSENLLSERTPPWMKVRLREAALFMRSSQETNDLERVVADSRENTAKYCERIIKDRHSAAFKRFQSLYELIGHQPSRRQE